MTTTKHIIVKGLGSQLGNRLIQLSNFIAFCKENNLAMHYVGFGSYSVFFEFTDTNTNTIHYQSNKSFGALRYLNFLLKYPFVKRYFYTENKIIERMGLMPSSEISHLVLGTVDGCDIDNENEPLMIQCHKSKYVIFEGWKYRATKSFDKHSVEIKRLLSPKETYLTNISSLIEKCKQKGEIIIGVHIRQGDYKTHLNGRFYYELSKYHLKMNECIKLFSDKKIVFLICSDQVWKESDFQGFNVQLAKGQIIEDLYSLSKCDYILGAPSTYSAWASFYGNVPLYHIVHQKNEIKSTDFVIFTQKHFVEYNDIYKQ